MRWLRSIALLVALAPGLAFAGPAEDAAIAATDVQQEHCADLGAEGNEGSYATAMASVAPVVNQLSDAYDETGAIYLLYWRGVLLQCIQSPDLAATNLRWFLGGVEGDMFANQIRDAKTRLRRMGEKPLPLTPPKPDKAAGTSSTADGDIGVAVDERSYPALLVGIGGGYQLTRDADKGHHYGAIAIDASIRLVQTLRLAIQLRPAIGGIATNGAGATTGVEDPNKQGGMSLLPVAGVGPHLWFWTSGAIRPHAGAVFQLAPNAPAGTSDPDGLPVLPGAAAFGGVDFLVGKAPLTIGPSVEVGFLGRYFSLRALVQLRINIG